MVLLLLLLSLLMQVWQPSLRMRMMQPVVEECEVVQLQQYYYSCLLRGQKMIFFLLQIQRKQMVQSRMLRRMQVQLGKPMLSQHLLPKNLKSLVGSTVSHPMPT